MTTTVVIKTIRTEEQTLGRLKNMAAGQPLNAFLRDISIGKSTVPVPVNELEQLRAYLVRELAELKAGQSELKAAVLKLEQDVQFAHGQMLFATQELFRASEEQAAMSVALASGLEQLSNRPGLKDMIIDQSKAYAKTEWAKSPFNLHLEQKGQ